MEYQLKNDSVEAWRIGSEPVPEWVAVLVEDKTIRGKTDGPSLSVSTDDGPKDARVGDYLTYSPTIWGAPTEDAPQGEIIAYRSVKLIPRDEFQKLYDVPADELPTAPAADQNALVASGEAARPLTAAEVETQPLAAEPVAEEAPLELHDDDLEPYESSKPKRKR